MSQNNHIQEILLGIQSQIVGPCPVVEDINNEDSIEIQKENLRGVVDFLIQDHQPVLLSTITADIIENDSEKIWLMYNFWKKKGFTLLIKLSRNKPELDTIMDLIPGADFYEREVAEMYGVRFTNREETPPLLLPDDWDQNPPMIPKKEQ